MASRSYTRRTALRSGAALAGTVALGRWGNCLGFERSDLPTLVILWLNGGPSGLFNSAASFLSNGAFGVTARNVRDLGNGLFVDADSLGVLPAAARAHIASINFQHGVVRPHEHARAAVLESGSRSQLLRMASAMPAGKIRCAVVNDLGLPVGVEADPPKEDGTAIERFLDLAALDSGVEAAVSRDVRAVYAVGRNRTAVADLATTFAAVELLVRADASVIFAQPAYTGRADRQFDTHEDDSGVAARAVMEPITPVLGTFLDRVLALEGRNVVTVLVGEFSRTVPKSDHEPGGTATVIGKRVRTGTAGPQGPDGAPPPSAPLPEGLWAFVASTLGVPATPFGRNPNPELIG